MKVLSSYRFLIWFLSLSAVLSFVVLTGCAQNYERVPVTNAGDTGAVKTDGHTVISIPHEIDRIERYGGTVLTAKGMPHGMYRAYLWAKNMGTLVAYETFLRRYPDGAYAAKFRELIRTEFLPEDRHWHEAWEAYSQMEVIAGAVVSPEVGIVLLGYKESGRLSPFMFEDLVTALKCALADDKVGVTMNRIFESRFEHDKTPNEYPYVEYETSVDFYSDYLLNTHLAYTLFEADRMLKSLGAGYDIFLREPIRSKIPGFRTETEMEAASVPEKRGSGKSKYGRVWIELTNVKVHTTEKRYVAAFQDFELEVRAESKHPGPIKFAKHLRKNYVAYSKEFPIFGEVERAGRLVAIARWMVKEHREVAQRLVDEAFAGVEVFVPQAIPARYVETHREVDYRAGLIGGVVFPKINRYENSEIPLLREDKLSSLPDYVLAQRPSDDVNAWYLDGDKQNFLKERRWIAWNVGGKSTQLSSRVTTGEADVRVAQAE